MGKRSRTKGAVGEEWRPIPGWDGFYSVSSAGRVRSESRVVPNRPGVVMLRRGLVMTPGLDTKGYEQVCLSRGGKGRTTKVHRLVALAFLGPRPAGLQVNHKNGDKRDNTPENLEYVTNRRNSLVTPWSSSGEEGWTSPESTCRCRRPWRSTAVLASTTTPRDGEFHATDGGQKMPSRRRSKEPDDRAEELSRRGRRSRRRGAEGERELCAFLRDQGFEARRRAEGQAGSKGDPDVEIIRYPWIFSEVKRCEALSLYPAVQQAQDGAGDYEKPFPPPCRGSAILPRLPLVWHRRNNREWLAILPAVDLCRLLRAIGPEGPGGRR